MDSTLSRNRWLPPTWLRFLVVILLTLGIFFRFDNIDRKQYWNDEVFTSVRVSGYTEADLLKNLSEPHVIGIKEFQKQYQSPSPEKGVIGTIRGLATEEPQLTPLYFISVRFWSQVFGSSVIAMRSFPAILSLLSFPCLYWLCLELFESSLIGWIALVLFAVSPHFVLYAQEDRPYSLWTLTILLSSVLLLRAMRLKTTTSWALYTVTLITSFYTYLFAVLIAIGHGLYVVAIERFRLSKTSVVYFVSFVLSTLAFSPWLLVIVSHHSGAEETTAWQGSTKTPLIELLRALIRHPSRAFLDLDPTPQDPSLYRIALMALTFVFFVFVGYSFYFLCRNAPKRIWLFIVALAGSLAIPLILHDVILGGFLSTFPKYLVPCYLSFILAVAYLFATQLTSSSSKKLQQKLWQIILIVLISIAVLSNVVIAQAEFWWTKGGPDKQQDLQEATQIINKTPNPLLISDDQIDTLLTISYLLDPKVKLLPIATRCSLCDKTKLPSASNFTLPKLPDGFSDIFLFPYPSPGFLSALKKDPTNNIEPVFKLRTMVLWKLKKTTKRSSGHDTTHAMLEVVHKIIGNDRKSSDYLQHPFADDKS